MENSAPGKRFRWIDVCTMATGMPLRLPLHEITGARPGPTFGLSAGIHGDEVPPLEVVRRVVQTVDPATLRGRILALPVGNPLALETVTRNTALDMLNLNRVFPGDPGGWISEQLAEVLTREFATRVDILVDLHAGGVFPTVDYVYIRNAEDLSRAFGFPVLYRSNANYASLTDAAARAGARCVVVELGGGLARDAEYIERGVRGVFNVLRAAGMLEGAPEAAPPQTVVRTIATLRPRHGGLLVPEVGLESMNREVAGGTVVGRVISPYTFEVLEEFRAPFARSLMILLRGAVTRVNPGDYAYMIGDLGTAE